MKAVTPLAELNGSCSASFPSDSFGIRHTAGDELAMVTSRMSVGDDAFTFGHMTAVVAFKSTSSVSFDLGLWSHTRSSFTVKGWIDVHHPCDGHIKTQIRVKVPAKYHEFEKMKLILRLTFESLSIPSDETYESEFFDYAESTGIENATDRNGMSDRIYSSG